MTKHKLKNIVNKPIPLEGVDFVPGPGQCIDVEITSRNKYLIQNKFYEDLGEIFEDSPKKKEKEEKEAKVKGDIPERDSQSVGSEEKTPTIKQSKKKRKKKKNLEMEMI